MNSEAGEVGAGKLFAYNQVQPDGIPLTATCRKVTTELGKQSRSVREINYDNKHFLHILHHNKSSIKYARKFQLNIQLSYIPFI